MSEKKKGKRKEEPTVTEEKILEQTEESTENTEAVQEESAAQTEKIAEELAAQKEQFLRLRAEYDNFRKRTQAEKAAVYNHALADAVQAILPVADNFDRALELENASAEDLQKGMKMIFAQLNMAFEQLGVKAIGEKGEDFDPNFHNAVAHVEDDTLEDGVIAAVLQKGYMIGDKVIRHAMVQVAN